MRNDQIFVLLLVVLLPMSGCFDGGGVGEAEGADPTAVVNHYYNNTTTIIESTPTLKHISVNSTTEEAFQITIDADEILEIKGIEGILVWNDSVNNDAPQNIHYLKVFGMTCYDGTEFPNGYTVTQEFVWKGVGACTYTFGLDVGYPNFGNLHYSVVYQVHTLV